MRAILQRVSHCSVSVENMTVASIEKGLLVLIGVGKFDSQRDIEYIRDKVLTLRIFADQNDKFDLSVSDIKGEILVVSQFTLFANCRKGRRPSFSDAALPEIGNQIYEDFVKQIRQSGLKISTGIFGAKMSLAITNDGPVTIILDSQAD